MSAAVMTDIQEREPVAKKRPTKPAEEPKKRPGRTGKPLHVYLDPLLLEALAAYVDDSRPRTTQTGAVEMALEELLTKSGHWPRPDQPVNEA